MSIEYLNGLNLYVASAEGPTLGAEQDALDLLSETYGTETDVIVVPASRFSADFFDLSSRQAGFFFQKIQNYRLRLVIIGDISHHVSRSKALKEFIVETNRSRHHLFVADRTEMAERLFGKV